DAVCHHPRPLASRGSDQPSASVASARHLIEARAASRPSPCYRLGMGRMALLLVLVAAACGGPEIPQHNGYKSDHAKTWKKARTLKFDDKNEAKAKGDLSYPDMRRAVWYDVEVVAPSELAINLEITQSGDTTNEDFDLGFEVLDPGFRKVLRKDKDEGDQQ